MTRLLHRLHSPRAPRWILLLGLLLALPGLGGGLVADDLFHRQHLSGSWVAPEGGPVWDLFRFVSETGREPMVTMGVLPWWSHPELEITFMRPVSALTHVLDYALWPDAAWVQHAHNIAWWLGAMLAVGALLRAVHGAGAVPTLALLLFTVEDAHAWPIGWVANRNALVALCFGALAALGHARWRQGTGAGALAASLVALGLGLGAGESAVGALAWLASWQLVLDPNRGWRRLTPLLPAAAVVLAWRIAYVGLGYRAYGSGLYIDPGVEPLAFARALAERAPILSLGQWLQVPVDSWVLLRSDQRLTLSLTGLAALGAIGLWLAPLLRAKPEARFHALSFLLALVPASATFPMTRLLTFAGVGAAGLLALQAERVGLLAPATTEAGRRPWGTLGMLVLHGPIAVLMLPTLIVAAPMVLDLLGSRMVEQAVEDSDTPPETLVYVTGDSLLVGYLKLGSMPPEREPGRVALLAPMAGTVVARRLDARTLELSAEGGLLWSQKDLLVRSLDLPFQPGDRVSMPAFDVEIVTALPDGQPERARFRFDKELEDPSLRLLAWDGVGFAPFSLAVGASAELPGLMP